MEFSNQADGKHTLRFGLLLQPTTRGQVGSFVEMKQFAKETFLATDAARQPDADQQQSTNNSHP